MINIYTLRTRSKKVRVNDRIRVRPFRVRVFDIDKQRNISYDKIIAFAVDLLVYADKQK